MRSLVTALLLAGTVMLFTVRVVAPILPPVVGPADLRESKELKLPVGSILRLSNSDGRVRVFTKATTAGSQADITADIKVYLRGDGTLGDATRYAKSLVHARSRGEILEILTEPVVRPVFLDLQVDYTIVVPPGTSLEIHGSNGNIWISEGCGDVEVSGGNTDIEIVRPAGEVQARSTNGRIRVVDAPRDATLETVNGNIYAHMLGGMLQASTANGHIVARVLDRAVVGFDLTSQNGGITMVLKDDSSVAVEARTGRGVIRSDFPFDGVAGIQDQKQFRGVLGTGDAKLHAETLNGNIWIARS